MLKSQQRKVFHMIKQSICFVSVTAADLTDSDPGERSSDQGCRGEGDFLEAENTEMRDQIEYFLEGQKPSSLPTKEWKPKPHCLQ
ncbi:uncharacterized protein LOC115176092 isoform X1 [Salmo trutta]|uniref:uncharacterized protein LOC115176092 isoform X1 n=1 Tax=Salmo trutta TaxID=8032 RepID=UPI00113148A6|nr:uncharacterized protein LOC115176092 isoform X1 [Salmo trutta]